MPASKTVPAGGLYVKVPGTEAVAPSWAAPSRVPNVIGAGVGHKTVGVAWRTTTWTVPGAVASKLESAPVALKVPVTFDVPADRTVFDAALHLPEPEFDAFPVPGVRVMVQIVVLARATVRVSVAGNGSPSVAVTVAENVRLVSEPYVVGPETARAVTLAERGATTIPTGLDVEPAKLPLGR